MVAKMVANRKEKRSFGPMLLFSIRLKPATKPAMERI